MSVLSQSGSVVLFLFGGVILLVGFFAVTSAPDDAPTIRITGAYAVLLFGGGLIIFGIVIAVNSKPLQVKLEEHKTEYLRSGRQKTRKESESNFCENCGNTLKPTAKFCGGCGTQRS